MMMKGVSRLVRRNLREPVLLARTGASASLPAIVSVPETPVNEDGLLPAHKRNVGTTGQITSMQAVARKACRS